MTILNPASPHAQRGTFARLLYPWGYPRVMLSTTAQDERIPQRLLVLLTVVIASAAGLVLLTPLNAAWLIMAALLVTAMAAFASGRHMALGAGVGSLLNACSWLVTWYLEHHGLSTYAAWDDALFVPGHLVWLYTIFNLQERATTDGSRLFLAAMAVASAAFLLLLVGTTHHFPLDTAGYVVIELAILWAAAPLLEAWLQGRAPDGRFFWIFGWLLWWFASCAHMVNESALGSLDRRTLDLIFFMGAVFQGLGLFSEYRRYRLGLWPFVLGVGGLLLAWTFGIFQVRHATALTFQGWLALGLLVVLSATLGLLVAYRERFLRAENRLRSWLYLLDALMDLTRQPLDQQQALSMIYIQLKTFLPDLCGLEIPALGDVRMGLSGHAYPILHNQEQFATLFFWHPPDHFEMKPLADLLASRLHQFFVQLEWRTKAMTDPLTGLHNRRSFETSIEGFVKASQFRREPMGLVLMDIDHFKQLNDTYGHDMGDKALAEIGLAIRQTVRESDLAVRWGGEEFLILFAKLHTHQQLQTAINRVSDRIKGIKLPDGPPGMTMSIGAVGPAIPSSRKEIAQWIQEADRALYEAKRAGRNCIRWAEDTKTPDS
jgi:diguanylate cyclase (GGDEF)-like protein